MGFRLLTTAVGLVTLILDMCHPSTYFHPNILLRWLSFMPQLETLIVDFSFPVPNCDVERQPMHMPIMMPITFPNLHYFEFRGVRMYLEALVHWITSPRLEKLRIMFFNQLTFSVLCLLQFVLRLTAYCAQWSLMFDTDKESEGRTRGWRWRLP